MHVGELVDLCDNLFREGRYTAGLAACDQALAGGLSDLERAQVLRLKAQALNAEDGRWGGPAVECLRQALSAAAEDVLERGSILAALTAAYGELGWVTLCRETRNTFYHLRHTHPGADLDKFYPLVEYNFGLAFHEAERLEDAETAYLLARAACLRSEDPAYQARSAIIDHNLVDIYQELGRHDEAKDLMDRSYSKLPDDVYGAQTRNRRAIYALHTGDLDAAVLWVVSGLGHQSCDVKTRAALLLTQAKIALSNGQVILAHDKGLEAFRLAAVAHSSRLGERVTRFLQQVKRGV